MVSGEAVTVSTYQVPCPTSKEPKWLLFLKGKNPRNKANHGLGMPQAIRLIPIQFQLYSKSYRREREKQTVFVVRFMDAYGSSIWNHVS